jgi:hypothetical protein
MRVSGVDTVGRLLGLIKVQTKKDVGTCRLILGRAYWVNSSRGRETADEFGCSMGSGGLWRILTSLGGSEREKSNYMSWALVAVGRLFQRTKVLAPGRRWPHRPI